MQDLTVTVSPFRRGNEAFDQAVAELRGDVARAADSGLHEALKAQAALVDALQQEVERLRSILAGAEMPERHATQIAATAYTRGTGPNEYITPFAVALANDGSLWRSRLLGDSVERWARLRPCRNLPTKRRAAPMASDPRDAYLRHRENVEAQPRALENAKRKLAAAERDLSNSGRLIEHTSYESGRVVRTYSGDISATFAPFMAPPMRIRIKKPDSR